MFLFFSLSLFSCFIYRCHVYDFRDLFQVHIDTIMCVINMLACEEGLVVSDDTLEDEHHVL